MNDLQQVSALINDGNSITVAMRMVYGRMSHSKMRAFMNNQEYCDILNSYMIKIGKNVNYILKNGVLQRSPKNKKRRIVIEVE